MPEDEPVLDPALAPSAEPRPLAKHSRLEALLAGQKHALELAVNGSALPAVLEALIHTLERSFDKTILGSILLLDRDGVHLRHGAAPSLPADYNEAINGIAIGASVGSCGTAAFTGQAVIVSDIDADPLWRDFRDVATAHGLLACWSSPIRSSTGRVLGTFAIYYREPRPPTVQEREVVELLAHTAAIIIERVRSQEDLRATADRYRLLGEAANDAIWDWDLVTNEVVWNAGGLEQYGFPDHQPDSYWWGDQIHPDDRARVNTSIRAAIDGTDESWTEEYRFKRSDGTYANVLDRGHVLRDAVGKPLRMVGSMFDLTERRRSQARDRFLVQLDDAVRPLTDAAAITYAAAATLGRHLGVHRCAYAVVDADEDAFLLTGNYTDGVPSIVGRYRFRQFGEACLRLMRAGEPYVVADSEADPRITAAERPSYRMTAIRAVICVPILKAGRFAAAMAVHMANPRQWRPDEVELVQQVASRCWESIERARVAHDLLESEHQFRELANSIANLAWMARPDGSIYWYNDQWFAYTGTTPGEMDGWGWTSVHDPRFIDEVVARWRHSVSTGTPFEMVFPLRGADGEYRRFLTRVNPVRDSQGQVVHWFGTNTDVEDERRATEANVLARHQVEELREAAEAANRAKDEFLAMLGHELRNPLSPILTALQLMKLRGGDDSERERTVIERQVTHLTRLVDDLLDVSRIARGKVELKKEILEISEVVTKAVEMASPLLEQRTHTLDLRIPGRGLRVEGDPTRLGQVVSNLLTNAAKYTGPGGRITVTAQEEDGEVVLRVCDTGIGIASDVLPHVFDLFVQDRQAIDRAQGGLGLGLTIVKNLVERHGGSVCAESGGPGLGSEFTVRLPAAPADALAAAAMSRSSPPGPAGAPFSALRILVVDDNEDAAEMLAKALMADGYSTEVAHDAPAALRVALVFTPHVAFLDIGLPVMDGYELAERLRSLPGMAGIRLIALTGYGQESDRQRTRAAGFHHHLVKPVDLDAVAAVVAS